MLKVTRSLLMFAVGVGAAFPILASAQLNNATGAVFVMSNDASKNEVIAFERAANGTLGESVSYETHGRGSGGITDPLEAQGSLTLSQDHSLLFAVNAGSGDITVFNVHKSASLSFLSKTPSGGAQPSAIAESSGLVYVLNSGGAAVPLVVLAAPLLTFGPCVLVERVHAFLLGLDGLARSRRARWPERVSERNA